MNLLAGTYYDPAVAVSEATTALLAMTALDTANLRLTFTGPPSGKVFVRIRGGCIHGATTFPQILVGCLENSPAAGTVRGRMAPQGGGFNGTALATTQLPVAVEYVQTVTPGQVYIWDAAYSVEIVLAATGWKYGGPNNTTTNDAFGGISFEIWDAAPLYTPAANGAAPTSTAHVKLDAIDDFIDTEIAAIQADTDNIQTRLPAALVGGRMDSSVGAIVDGVLTSAKFAAGAFDAVWTVAARILTAGTNIVLAKGVGVTGLNDLDAAGVRGAVGLAAANLDTQLDALPTAAEIRVEMDANSADLNAIGALVTMIEGRVDVATSTRLATAGYTAPDNAGIAAIQAKTDSLTFTVAGKLDVNVLVVNGVTLQGAGTAGDKWRAA